jgi:CRP-like cAMP-binding protein
MDTNFSLATSLLPQSSTLRFLENLPLFKDLNGGALVRIARGAAESRLPEGTVIFREGDLPGSFYLVVDGLVKLSLQTVRGDEKVIELIGRGENFGAAPLLLGERYTLTAETLTESLLLPLNRSAVLEEIEGNPEFASRMLRDVCRRLQARTRDFENCMLLSGAQRVTKFLLGQIPNGAHGKNVAVTLPAKKGIIASRLNLTHEHFSRVLHEIQAAGLIEVRGREIHMHDVGRLRAYPG